jgi:large subunit ribosomal protein L21
MQTAERGQGFHPTRLPCGALKGLTTLGISPIIRGLSVDRGQETPHHNYRGIQVMYAVIRTGGKQYRVMQGETLRVEKLEGDVGSAIELKDILMVGDGDKITIGAPVIENALIKATIKSHGRLEKIKIVKFRRRKHHRKQMGHRQHYTEIEINGISL